MSVGRFDTRGWVRRLVQAVSVRRFAGLLGGAVMATSVLLSPTIAIPAASAAPCPDIQVVFARGTFEPPGVGATGEAFVDSLRGQVGGKSVDVYPVDYPASLDFQTAADGVIDASNKVRDISANCPNTKIVLGGYSQGAAVAGYITSDAVPVGFTLPAGITGPMPPTVADHVVAVALFGKPSNGFLNRIDTNAPPITIGHYYSAKTIDLCIPEDPICSPDGNDNNAHVLYAVNGMAAQAADFVARRLAAPGSANPRLPGPTPAVTNLPVPASALTNLPVPAPANPNPPVPAPANPNPPVPAPANPNLAAG